MEEGVNLINGNIPYNDWESITIDKINTYPEERKELASLAKKKGIKVEYR